MQKEFIEETEKIKKEIKLYGYRKPINEDVFIFTKNNGGNKEKILILTNLVENVCYDDDLKEEIKKVHHKLIDKYFPE